MKRNIYLCIPPAWAMTIDTIFTGVHQAQEYWKGNLTNVNEGNPVVYFFMNNHVYGLFIIYFLWLSLTLTLIYFAPKRIAMAISFAIVIGNSYGAATWIRPFYGFWFIILLFIINGIILALFVEKAILKPEAILANETS